MEISCSNPFRFIEYSRVIDVNLASRSIDGEAGDDWWIIGSHALKLKLFPSFSANFCPESDQGIQISATFVFISTPEIAMSCGISRFPSSSCPHRNQAGDLR